MDATLRLNQMPSPTWNRLKVNEAVERGFAAAKEPFEEKKVPGGVSFEQKKETAFPDQKTGAGEEVQKTVTSSNIPARSFVFENSKEDEPLYIELPATENKSALLPIELSVKAGSKGVAVMFFTCEDDEEVEQCVQTKYEVLAGASLTLIQIISLSKKSRLISDIGGKVEENGKFHLIQLVLKGGQIDLGALSDLSGKKSSLETDIVYLTGQDEVLDINEIANHIGKNTNSLIRVNGVLSENGKKTFRGTIDLRRGAKGAVGTETEEVLLMDDGVVNRSVPVILCTEEDVEGNHGATIGKIDSDSLFYLESRGIPEEMIYDMLSKAVVDSIKKKIGDEATIKRIDELTR